MANVNDHQAAYDVIKDAIERKEVWGAIWSAATLSAECWWNYREADLLNDADWNALYKIYKAVNK